MKRKLNNDGKKIHQYQQNKQTALSEHKKRSWHTVLEIQVIDWDRNKNVVALNQLMGS